MHLFTSSPRNNQEHLAPSQRTQASNWLNLLTWSPERAAQLIEVVGGLQLEPHPVSGELELFGDDEDDGKITYRRLDSETLQAKCDVKEHGISVIWMWCENDTGAIGLEQGGDTEPSSGWRVAEVRPFEEEMTEHWHDTMRQAEEAVDFADSLIGGEEQVSGTTGAGQTKANDGEDDDDYWNSYDRTPAARTPAQKHTPVPQNTASSSERQRQYSTAEEEYFSRYGSEVQPAMDGHDPDEAEDAAGVESSLNVHELGRSLPRQTAVAPSIAKQDSPIIAAAMPDRIHSPSPSRASSAATNVEQLEASASSSSAAEQGIRQHVSYEIKSLYRLARAAGIDREEFMQAVQTELDVLEMMDV